MEPRMTCYSLAADMIAILARVALALVAIALAWHTMVAGLAWKPAIFIPSLIGAVVCLEVMLRLRPESRDRNSRR